MQKIYGPTELPDVFKIYPLASHEDYRGTYTELYNEFELFQATGHQISFVQDDCSVSNLNVLRGIHGDKATWKLVSCIYGSIYLVVVDNRPHITQLGTNEKRWLAFTISDKNRVQVLVPPNVGVGHLVLSDTAIFWYKQSTYYNRDEQFTIPWNSPAFNIWWPIKNPIVSERDKGV